VIKTYFATTTTMKTTTATIATSKICCNRNLQTKSMTMTTITITTTISTSKNTINKNNNNKAIKAYFASHLDVKVVLVSIATAEQKLLTLIGRSVVEVPRPVACARALLGQKIAKF
jgi:ABC-type glycerol-3-phosphate transport system substrate-binding protein